MFFLTQRIRRITAFYAHLFPISSIQMILFPPKAWMVLVPFATRP